MSAHPVTPARPTPRPLTDPRSTGSAPRLRVVDLKGLHGTLKR